MQEKYYTIEDYEGFVENRKKTINSLKAYIPIFIILLAFLSVLINLKISILITSLGLITYLSIIEFKIKNYNKKIKKYEDDVKIEEEKQEIKKYLNKLRKLLRYLNLEQERIDFYTNKYLSLIEKAETIVDYQLITQSIKDEYMKYYEILDEDRESYNQESNFANSYRKNQESYYERKDHRYYYDADAFERQQKEKKSYQKTNTQTQTPRNEFEEKVLNHLLTLELTNIPRTRKELKTHYRSLLKKYHPDTASKSKSFTERELEEKTMQINEAYDYINEMIKED